MSELFMKRSATISDCGQYRYTLRRVWDETLPEACFVMLNPSTADADKDDPTIRKCIGFASRLGFGGFMVVNLFAFRATDPGDLKRAGYPVGPQNDAVLGSEVLAGHTIICAWGSNAEKLPRVATVMQLLRGHGHQLHALRINGYA